MTTNPTPEDLLTNLKARPHPKQTHLEMAGGFAYITVNDHKIAYDGERWFACGQTITPRFTMNSLHQEIDRVFRLAQKIKDHVLNTDTKEQTTMTPEYISAIADLVTLNMISGVTNLRYLDDHANVQFDYHGRHFEIDCDGWCVDGAMSLNCLLSTNRPLTVEMFRSEVNRVLMDVEPSLTWEQIKADCVGPDLPTSQTFVSTDRYRELEAELAKMTAERDDLSVRVKQKTDVITAQAAQIQQHADGWEQAEAQLKTVTASRDATQERVEALQQLLPLFGLGVNALTDKAQEKIEGLYSRVKELGLMANDLTDQLKTVTEERDAAQKKNVLINGQLSDLRAEREGLFAKIDHLKSRVGLLSVVCRRLCGDEDASIETVHAAIDRCHDEFNALDFIGERLGIDPNGTDANRLNEIQSLVAQTVKSLSEKTVENDRLKISLSATEAQLREVTQGRDHDDGIRSEIAVKVGLDSSASLGLILETVNAEQSKTMREMERLRFERDTERVGKKWLSETIEDLKRTTVKLPNEHTLRRLFNRHNTPDKYDDGTPIPTIERFLLIIENLCRNADCSERRFEELNAISTRVNTESEDAHATLDEMGIPRWTTANNYGERYLSLSARIRQLFATHTKV